MKVLPLLFLSVSLALALGDAAPPASGDATVEPFYDAKGRLQMPAHYREWTYLTSGFDMSYNPKAETSGHSTFDNVFVNPAAYRAFKETGTWPDKTVLVLENRAAQGRGSINQSGHFQSTERTGLEVHVRDEAKTPGKWAFYDFDGEKPSEQIPASADCYSCHEQHAAVATTFVQFYPTLLPIARGKKTLSRAYLKESEARDRP